MISIFKKHKNVILFLLKFFATYTILFSVYDRYLQHTQVDYPTKCDPLTVAVTEQMTSILEMSGYKTLYLQHPEELSQAVYVNRRFVVRIIEGCNSVSVIILFIAFVVAFSNGFVATLIYVVLGGGLLYMMNLFRLALLSVLILKFPQHQSFFHDLLFPAIIYGTIFLLWVLWVNKFSKLK